VGTDLDKDFLFQYQQRANKNPEDVDALIKLSITTWAPFHDYEKAVSLLKRAAELDPSNVDALFWLATVYYHDFCQYEMAGECLEKALKLLPERPDCLALMGYVKLELEESPRSGIEFIRKAIANAPDWPIPTKVLIECLVQENGLEKAEEEIEILQQMCMKLNDYPRPNNPVDEYYENCVTGRYNPIDEEWFCRMWENIRISRERR